MEMAPLHVSEDDESDENDESASEQFDIRLTVNHLYLQCSDLGELPAEIMYVEPGKEISVPLFVMETVLLPGQILPLHFTAQICIDFIRATARKRSYFCLMTIDLSDHDYDFFEFRYTQVGSKIGTLFEVKNVSADDNRLTLQAVGRQRCLLQQVLRHSDVFYNDYVVVLYNNVKVVVLEEYTLPPFIYMPGSTLNRLPTKEKRKYYSMMTQNDKFAIKQCSTESVVYWLKNWLQKWFDLSRINVIINQGYTVFGYWVAANLPVDMNTKLMLLEEMCTDRRLRIEWRIASQINSLACSSCGDIKCEINDLISLSVEGNGLHFVNPSGYVHEMFTTGRINNITLSGPLSTEFSWFPGYAWTILHCGNCGRHIGWRFTSPKLLPKKFYGITRKMLQLVRTEDNSQNSP